MNRRSRVESDRRRQNRGGNVAAGLAWRTPRYWPGGVRHRGGVNLDRGSYVELREPSVMMQRERHKQRCEAYSTEASPRGRRARSSVEAAVMAGERRGSITKPKLQANRATGRSL